MGRTNVVIDDRLIRQAMKITGAKTKREAIDIALRRLVDRESVHQALRRLRGRLKWDGDIAAWRKARL
ncbi:MAG: type II toxin-antitoxin system VapB family antitoxin [Candidatus Rokubacteria bacterium]|nr:type II toxin-antitoxin system VapB family antitoxin [Candidatus Rokubacteria bacterium]